MPAPIDTETPVGPPEDQERVRKIERAVQKTLQCISGESSGVIENYLPVSTGAFETEYFPTLERVVRSETFEFVFAMMILANACVMAVSLQYTGLNIGHTLHIRTYDEPGTRIWPHAPEVVNALDRLFTVIFTIEIVMRLLAYRCRWLLSKWNYLDCLVVSMALYGWLAPGAGGLNPTFVRLIRLAKLMRVMRVMRSNRVLDSLKLLMVSISASFNTLFWSLCLLLLIQSIAGMLIGQLVESYMLDTANDEAIRQEVFRYYGTFWRCTVTMFEISYANWAPPCRLLLDHLSEWYGVFFVVYRCAIGFAVLSVIQAVFIQQTMKNASMDDDMMMQERESEKSRICHKLERVFHNLDISGDGYVQWDEFEPLLKQEQMQVFMSTLEIDYTDIRQLFCLLDDGDGQISLEEFIFGVQRMKGSAKSLDVVALLSHVKRVEEKMDNLYLQQSPGTTRHSLRRSDHQHGTLGAFHPKTPHSARNARIGASPSEQNSGNLGRVVSCPIHSASPAVAPAERSSACSATGWSTSEMTPQPSIYKEPNAAHSGRVDRVVSVGDADQDGDWGGQNGTVVLTCEALARPVQGLPGGVHDDQMENNEIQ